MSTTSATTTLTDLPIIVLEKIVGYLSYEEISRFRLTCKFIQKYAEEALNEGFFKLGRKVSLSSTTLKKQLPKKESERRTHPLSRHSEVFTALETRYTLLQMTYRKYIDQRCCCFIPGQVLDVAFNVMRQINGFLEDVKRPVMPIDVINILRDFRDYSSMAMEHFDEHIAPRFSNRAIPLFRPFSSTSSTPFSCYSLSLINSQQQPSGSAQKSESTPITQTAAKEDSKDLYNSLRNELRNKLDEQSRVIGEQRKVIGEQGVFIRQIVDFLGEMGRQNEWAPRLMDNFHRLSSDYNSVSGGDFQHTTPTMKLKGEKGQKADRPVISATVKNSSPSLPQTSRYHLRRQQAKAETIESVATLKRASRVQRKRAPARDGGSDASEKLRKR